MERLDAPGFSLPELLITLAIVAILATITVPSYQGLVARSRHADAASALVLAQLAQQRWRVDHATYAADITMLAPALAGSPQGYYRLRVAAAGAGYFLLLAEPENSDACGTFALDASGPVYGPPYATRRCWNH